jgi:phenylacetate-CoA ligase
LPADLDGVELTDLPILSKEDFRGAQRDLMARVRRSDTGALVLGSGGTTAKPKLSLIPSDMFIGDLVQHWRPLGADDVLVNLNNGGELGSMHPFYNRLAQECGALVAPLGTVDVDRYDVWLDFMDEVGATAVGATPSFTVRLLEHCEKQGRRPPALRTFVWTGEAFGPRGLEVIRRVRPDLRLHGVYGSTETWVVGHNGPACRVDTFHVLPYQHVEIVDGAVVVTSLHSCTVNPVLRYRIGDKGRLGTCACGSPGPALRVLGRDDEQVKFLSILFLPEEVADVARSNPAVRDVQIAMFDHGDPGERLELLLRLDPVADPAEIERQVRHDVLTSLYRVGFEVGAANDAFVVRAVDRLIVNRRTNKTPLLVHDPR